MLNILLLCIGLSKPIEANLFDNKIFLIDLEVSLIETKIRMLEKKYKKIITIHPAKIDWEIDK